MKNYRKIIYPLTALLLAFVLAACQGTRNLNDVEIVGPDGDAVPLTLTEDGSLHLELHGLYDDGTIDRIMDAFITWDSDDSSVLSVNSDTGVVTAEGLGMTTIRALHSPATDGEFRDDVTITVVPAL